MQMKGWKNMETYVYCVQGKDSWHSFYLEQGQEQYYLFSQKFRKGVQNFYGKKVRLDKAVDYSRSHHDSAIIRTMRKLPVHIRSAEKEYDIVVLNRTQKRVQSRKNTHTGTMYM